MDLVFGKSRSYLHFLVKLNLIFFSKTNFDYNIKSKMTYYTKEYSFYTIIDYLTFWKESLLQKNSILEDNVNFGRNSIALKSYNLANFKATRIINKFLDSSENWLVLLTTFAPVYFDFGVFYQVESKIVKKWPKRCENEWNGFGVWLMYETKPFLRISLS